MSEQIENGDLETAIAQGNFRRAALLAASLGLPKEEIKDLQQKAVWQMAAQNRNAAGTKTLAQEYEFAKDELGAFLESRAQTMSSNGDDKILRACYDYSAAGKHLDFAAWLDNLFKNWNKVTS